MDHPPLQMIQQLLLPGITPVSMTHCKPTNPYHQQGDRSLKPPTRSLKPPTLLLQEKESDMEGCKAVSESKNHPGYSNDSLFYSNYVEQCLQHPLYNETNHMDFYAWSRRTLYPDGDMSYYTSEQPAFGWARENRSKGEAKTVKMVCLSVYVCFVSGCLYRFRPKVPRRTKGSDKRVPDLTIKDLCMEHIAALTYISCNCRWNLKNEIQADGTSVWKVTHTGSYNHPAPQPS
jgi:hypothetical protein